RQIGVARRPSCCRVNIIATHAYPTIRGKIKLSLLRVVEGRLLVTNCINLLTGILWTAICILAVIIHRIPNIITTATLDGTIRREKQYFFFSDLGNKGLSAGRAFFIYSVP